MFSKRYILFPFVLIFQFVVNSTVDGFDIDDFIYLDRAKKLAEGYPLDSLLNFTEIATAHGYASEEHTVVTEDGYIMSLFRITKGKNCQGPIREPPVLLMHGLLLSSDAWLDSGPTAGLAYLISDNCYDLWAGNTRGNYYGKRHVILNETDVDFWQFSVNEIGHFDLPAIVDYITNYTSSDVVNYIGYSQGGSTFFIMCSERTEYCEDKVQLAIFLEPASKMTYTRSLFFRLLMNAYQIGAPLLTEVGIYEALPLGGIVQQLAAYFCKNYIIADSLCRLALSIIDSPHPGSIATTTIQTLFGHFPAGTSVKNMVWYNQALNVDRFQNFDYGTTLNIELYNSTAPPAYNMSAVVTPTVVINGRNDFITSLPDIEWLASSLPNLLEHYIVIDSWWNHFDVPYSQYTSTDIMPKILEYLGKYSNMTDTTD